MKGGVIGEAENLLDSAFSESSLPDQDTTIMISNCPRNKFCGTSGPLINQHDQQHISCKATCHIVEGVLVHLIALIYNNAIIDKLTGNFHRFLEQPTTVVAQVENDRRRAQFFQELKRSDEFIAARGVDQRVLQTGASVANDQIWFPPAQVLLNSGLATELVR